ncbi:ribosomal protein S15 [Bonamia ostreae]|uniref:Ribosomal protein S15 n=1 Tax=Bonamia ostreae TaxID=126728 RepID=A0ABV2AIX4_9EUKA
MSSQKTERKRFRKYYYRGVDILELIDASKEEFKELLPARMRRKIKRGKKNREIIFRKKLLKAKHAAAKRTDNKIKTVKTHLRNVMITPDMISSRVAVYTGKEFKEFEIRQNMIGHYTGEFALTYNMVAHNKSNVSKTSRFVPLK